MANLSINVNNKAVSIISLEKVKKKLRKQNANLSNSLIKPPKYFAQMKKRQVQSNNDGKAMKLIPYLFRFSSMWTRVFHITWITFFICFFGWFSVSSLSFWMDTSLNLSLKNKSAAKGIQSLSTILFRIVFGDLCDKIGARRSYVLLLIISCIALTLQALISQNTTTYLLFSFSTGILGASFVITQFHVTAFFSAKCVGIANALSAGWGNFGGGVTMIITPLICNGFINMNISPDIAWRYTLLVPASLLFIMIFIYYKYTIDTPEGNKSNEQITLKICCTFNKYKWKRVLSDHRVWLLSLSYAICFGIEVTVLNYFVDYFVDQFDTNMKTAGFITFGFSFLNLFARGFGGYLSDILYLRYGIQGRIYCLFWTFLFESAFLLMFAFSSFHFGYSLLMMVFFSLYVQIAEGIVFAIVPILPHNKHMGLCMGIVGAGGNLGAMLYALILFVFVPQRISYTIAWIICACSIFVFSLTVLFINFTEKEISEDLKAMKIDYFSTIDHSNTSDKQTAKNAGFVIH